VSFLASSSAFWLPELCCTVVSRGLTTQRCLCAPPSRISGTPPPSLSCSLRSPSVLRCGRPLLASCGLGVSEGGIEEVCIWFFTFSCCFMVSYCPCMQILSMTYLAGRSSELRARPVSCVSYAEVMVGCGALRRAGFGYPRSFGRTAMTLVIIASSKTSATHHLEVLDMWRC
jgi:hypothetical protein